MKHHFLDRYAYLSSPIHSLNTTVKLVITLTFVISVVNIPEMTLRKFLFSLFILFTALLISRVPIAYFFRNLLILTPFVFLAGISTLFIHQGRPVFTCGFITIYDSGLLNFVNTVSKSLISLSFVQIFITTTRFDALLEAMKGLRFPLLILEIFSFIYRYVYIFSDELMRSRMAALSRGKLCPAVWSNILRGAFIRSLERGKLIYLSMKARGFEGKFRTLKKSRPGHGDFVFIAITVILVSLLWKL